MATSPPSARVLTCYYRPKPGGLCKRLFQAIEALLASGHEVHYLAVAPFPIRHERCHFHRYPWPPAHTEGHVFWGLFHLLAPLMLLYLGLRHRVTYAFAFSPTYGFLLQPLRLIKRLPLAVFLRADLQEHHRTKNRGQALLRLELLVERLAIAGASVYPASETLRDKLRARHGRSKPKRVETFPNTIPCVVPIESQRKDGEPLRLGCVGTLDRVKNHAVVIRCMQRVPPNRAHLFIYGTGLEERVLADLVARLGVEDRVDFLGWCDSPQCMWASIDILLFPSLHEGSPNAVLEALGYGVPVLASDIPEHREILPAEALVTAADENAWTNRLLEIIESPNIRLPELLDRERSATRHLHFDWNGAISSLILRE